MFGMFASSSDSVRASATTPTTYVDGLGQVQIEKLGLQKPDGRAVEVKNATTEDINPFGSGPRSRRTCASRK
jgi:hypothetical protein